MHVLILTALLLPQWDLSMEDFVGYGVRLARHRYRSCNFDQPPYILWELACVNTCHTAMVQLVAVTRKDASEIVLDTAFNFNPTLTVLVELCKKNLQPAREDLYPPAGVLSPDLMTTGTSRE